MGKYLYIIILLFTITNSWGNPKYKKIDKQSKSVPDTLTTPKEIAEYLTSELENVDEKIRALHIWITHNIKYDLTQLNFVIEYTNYDKIVEDTINFRKGVCDNYSLLFHYMCNSIGIESYVISGYTRQMEGNEIPELSHSWNIVKIKDIYLFVDNTWASGYVDKKGHFIHKFIDKYFLIPPSEFIKTHVPFDPVWQFLDNPISNVDLLNKDLSNFEVVGNFDYKDSISTIGILDTINQIQKKINRIIKSGITNGLIQKHVSESEEQIEKLTYNRWRTSFNDINKGVSKAKDEINMGINFDNKYIGYFNKKFRNPKIENSQIENTIEKANLHFYKGKNQLKKSKQLLNRLEYLGKSIENLKLTEKHRRGLEELIIELEYKILEVEPLLIKDTEFTKNYLKKQKQHSDTTPL